MAIKHTSRSLTLWKRTSYLQSTPCVGTYEPGTRILSTSAWEDTRTGVDNPDWRVDIRKRRNAGTALYADREKRSSNYWTVYWDAPWPPSCGAQYFGRRRWRRLEGTYVSFDTTLNSGALTDNTDNLALTKVYGKLNDAMRGLEGLVALGELAETLRMIKKPGQGLREGLNRYLDDAKRRVKRLQRNRGRGVPPSQSGVTRASKVLADTWLEHVFGWGPLISDIEGGVKSLNLLAERNLFPMDVVTAQADAPAVSQLSTARLLYGDASPVYAYWSKNRKVSTRYRVAIALEPRTLTRAALDSFGLNARSFVPAVWELIPYSFLIDYFTNIGDIVSSFSVNRSRILWIVKTIREEYVNSIDSVFANSFFGADGTTKFEVKPSASWQKVVVRRSTPVSLNYPSLDFEIPGLSSRKWLNIGALVRSGRSTESAIRRSLRV